MSVQSGSRQILIHGMVLVLVGLMDGTSKSHNQLTTGSRT